jgi:outer membrane lipoprotein SlyB
MLIRHARLVYAAILLSGCAAHVVPPPVVQTSPIEGRLERGVVVSVRPVDPAADPAVTSAILTALGQAAAAPSAPNSVEIVVRRQDNSVTSIVEQLAPGQPAFTPGESVAIVEAATTIIRPE